MTTYYERAINLLNSPPKFEEILVGHKSLIEQLYGGSDIVFCGFSPYTKELIASLTGMGITLTNAFIVDAHTRLTPKGETNYKMGGGTNSNSRNTGDT
jgi:hypothetical protein